MGWLIAARSGHGHSADYQERFGRVSEAVVAVGKSVRNYTHSAVQMHECVGQNCGAERNKEISQQLRCWELKKGHWFSKNGHQQQVCLKEGIEHLGSMKRSKAAKKTETKYSVPSIHCISYYANIECRKATTDLYIR